MLLHGSKKVQNLVVHCWKYLIRKYRDSFGHVGFCRKGAEMAEISANCKSCFLDFLCQTYILVKFHVSNCFFWKHTLKRRRMKTWKTVLALREPELFERRKILKIGQVVAILVHFELVAFYSETEYATLFKREHLRSRWGSLSVIEFVNLKYDVHE